MMSEIYDGGMHRTTINLDEAVYDSVTRMARSRGRSMARMIEELLRSALGEGRRAGAKRREPPIHRDNGPLPGVDIADRDRLYDIMQGR